MRCRVLVVGTGIAGLTCAHLLAGRRWEVELWDLGADRSPPLLLHHVTAQLLHDLWQDDALLDGAVRLRVRTVRWGNGLATTLRHPAVVIDGRILRERLLRRVSRRVRHVEVPPATLAEQLRAADQPGVVTFDASGRAAHAAAAFGKARRQVFGRRCVLSAPVTLAGLGAPEACWMETVPDGWVFCFPIGPANAQQAVLQAMVPSRPEDPEATLRRLHAETQMIKSRVGAPSGQVAVFAAAPQRAQPLLGAGWIAVGDAAIALDPVSGNGTGHGLRGAILATSIAQAIAAGQPEPACLHHYDARLTDALRVHLQRCLAHYASAPFASPAWRDERAVMERALRAMERHEDFAYGLRGLQLVTLQ